MHKKSDKVKAILFDFDGTLADTSLDMINSLNVVLKRNKYEKVKHFECKDYVSKGANGIVGHASIINCISDDDIKNNLKKDFLKQYSLNPCQETFLFEGIKELITFIMQNNLKWGIVTNKPSYLSEPIIEKLDFPSPPQCCISGDTLDKRKPDPLPLLHAAKLLGIEPSECIYIGDDERDMIAGNKAGMKTISALYGFIPKEENALKWQCDYSANDVYEIINILEEVLT